MKWLWCALVATSVAAPTTALTSEYTDFRIPKHWWRSISAGASGQLSGEDAHSSGGPAELSTRSGSVNARGVWGFDSDRILHEYSLAGRISGSNRHQKLDLNDPSSTFRRRDFLDRHDQIGAENWDASILARLYPWRLPVGFAVQSEVSGDYSRQRYSERSESIDADSASTTMRLDRDLDESSSTHEISYAVSTGLGRVRDATSVYRVHVLESRLARSGMLSQPLSSRARERIAELFFIRPNYSVVHDRPDRFFWRDLERVLIQDGALKGSSLDAYSAHLVLEAIRPRISSTFQRRAGYFAGLIVEGKHRRRVSRFKQDFASELYVHDTLVVVLRDDKKEKRSSDSDGVFVGADVELYYPVSHRIQLDLVSRFRIPTRDLDAFELNSFGLLTYLIADRLEVRGAIGHTRSIPGEERFTLTAWRVSYSASLEYRLEDRTRVTLSANASQQASDLSRRIFRRRGSLSIGITYFLQRGLDAPDLFEPHRMLPPSPPLD